MHIVTDGAADISPEQLENLQPIHTVPISFTLDGKTYRSGVDIQPEGFYQLLESTGSFPTTSQPSPGDFADVFRVLAQTDPEILMIHISHGLSGTGNSARLGAQRAPEAKVTFYDTRTLSGAQGWHVVAAARAAKAGWSMQRIVEMLATITTETETLYTLATLKYLIHGGRISHLRGLVGSLLDIKPIIGVAKEDGKYVQRGNGRSLKKALLVMLQLIARQHAPGSELRVQVMHGNNPDMAHQLRDAVDAMFRCTWLPMSPIAPVLGAHTGSGLVGIVYAPQSAFAGLP
ncbi:MAG: DegV family protein [Anaerolineae bacterium]|nr:DegV family protein [Anaerolineae bacterium]